MNGVQPVDDDKLVVDGKWVVIRGFDRFLVMTITPMDEFVEYTPDMNTEIVPCLPMRMFDPIAHNAHQIADIIRRAMSI